MCADRQLPSIKHKLVLLGDQSVGKTSIINRFMYDYFDSAQYQATIGIDFFSKNITVERAVPPPTGGGPSGAHAGASPHASGGAATYDYVVKLHVWDTAGQERYRSLIPSYVRNSSAAIVVYDVGNRESFLSAFTWVDEIKQALGISSTKRGSGGGAAGAAGTDEDGGDDIVIMLVGNKLDVSADGGREVSTEEAERRANENGFLFCEVSAKNGTNIKQLFRTVAQSLPAPPPSSEIGAEGGGGKAAAAGGGQGTFGAATRDPFLITPSVMSDAAQRQQQQQGGGSAQGAGRSCC